MYHVLVSVEHYRKRNVIIANQTFLGTRTAICPAFKNAGPVVNVGEVYVSLGPGNMALVLVLAIVRLLLDVGILL